MISYGLAKARAMAGRDDWNEREAIKSATILWYDTEEEGYELEIENEDDLDAEDFRAWVEENADSLAQEDAAANGTTFEGIEEIEYETEGQLVVDDTGYTPINNFTTVELGCEKGNVISTTIVKDQSLAQTLIRDFNEIWNDKKVLQEVTDEVVESITAAY